MKVLVDTNVILDVLLARPEFYADSARVLTLADRDQIEGCIAAISVNNCYYVVRKTADRKSAEKAVKQVLSLFDVCELDADILQMAAGAGFNDFEDAIQWQTALKADVDCVVTRNPADFPKKVLPVLTPAEFLATHNFGK